MSPEELLELLRRAGGRVELPGGVELELVCGSVRDLFEQAESLAGLLEPAWDEREWLTAAAMAHSLMMAAELVYVLALTKDRERRGAAN